MNVRGALLGRARALRNSIFGRGRSGGRRGVRGPLSGALFAVGAGLIAYTVIDGFFDASTFPAGSSFQLAYSCHVWEHLANPRATAEAARENWLSLGTLIDRSFM